MQWAFRTKPAHLALLAKCSVRLAALEDTLSRLKICQSWKLSLVAARGVLRSPEGILRRYRRKFRASAILILTLLFMLISRKPSVYFHLFHISLERLQKTVNWVSNVTMSSFPPASSSKSIDPKQGYSCYGERSCDEGMTS